MPLAHSFGALAVQLVPAGVEYGGRSLAAILICGCHADVVLLQAVGSRRGHVYSLNLRNSFRAM